MERNSTTATTSFHINEVNRPNNLQQNSPQPFFKEDDSSRIPVTSCGILSVAQASKNVMNNVDDFRDDGCESVCSLYIHTSSEDEKDGSDSDGRNENTNQLPLQSKSHQKYESDKKSSSGSSQESLFDLYDPRSDLFTNASHVQSADHDNRATDSKGSFQAKPKIMKCKLCDFVTLTKEDFWKHSKTHIRPEKILSCHKCSFVTEFKHHMEYHLRNHVGSKPFKCSLCDYSCVNKSMLNSHMKSHTTIYQYRCADCNYATKYCHSLKLHLRKYRHSPDIVLNPDGTPNPLPIVDVYGTKRGPKLKRFGIDTSLDFQHDQNKFQEEYLKIKQLEEVTQKSSLSPHISPYLMVGQMKMEQTLSIESKIAEQIDLNKMSFGRTRCTKSSLETCNHGSKDHPSVYSAVDKSTSSNGSENSTASLSPSKYERRIENEEQENSNILQSSYLEYFKRVVPLFNMINFTPPEENSIQIENVALLAHHFEPTSSKAFYSNLVASGRALDLTRRDDDSHHVHQSNMTGLGNPEDGNEETYENKRILNRTDFTYSSNLKEDAPEMEQPPTDRAIFAKMKLSGQYICQYCQIAFMDFVMFSSHIEYHDDSDPLKCKKCNVVLTNARQFFLHLIRDPHLK